MINLTHIASSLAQVALSDSTKPKMERAINVASHIAGKVALQITSSLLEQKGLLNERQQKGLSMILKALSGKEPLNNVETHEGGGRFNLARAAFDVASVVWERDKSMHNVMSFLGVSDSKGKMLFSLGKKLADAMAKSEPGKDNSEATNARLAYFSSNLKLNKLMSDLTDQVFNKIRQSNGARVRRPTPGPSWRPDGAQQQARPQALPGTRPQACSAPPPKAEPRPASGRPDGHQKQARPETPPRTRRGPIALRHCCRKQNPVQAANGLQRRGLITHRLLTHLPGWAIPRLPSRPSSRCTSTLASLTCR
ncbi:Type III effector HopI1 [Pseudomonas coronafaciens pv. zizaniae]|nr:hypothetical protein HBB04_03488 [Pseudomonas coronafaciens]RMM79320.1 Type III effector HopI1 [Pseudomonas coronafaciens pv. striafaciens]RMN30358.1 Type III effector HopI1 [Pseudomonas coronafaciens pv. zizaniae]